MNLITQMKMPKPAHNQSAQTLPSGWREVKLGDAPIIIIDGDRGKNYPKKKDFSNQGYCLFLNTKNVTESGFSFSELNFITKEKNETLGKGELKRKDTVLTTRGTIGNVVFYNKKVPYENMRINSGMVIIRPIGINEIFNYYLFKHLNSVFFNFSSGSAQPQLPIRDLKEISVLLPPLPEQKAIAEVLSSLDDKIDLLQRQNKTLEDMAQTIFKEWFVNFNYPDSSGEMVKRELGEIPKGWRIGRLKDITDKISKGTTPRKEELENLNRNIPFLKVKDITDGGAIKLNSLELIPLKVHESSLNRSKLQENDILFSIAGTIGRVSIVPKILDNSNCNQAIAFIRILHKESFLEYVHQWIKSKEVQFEIKSNIVQGVQANVSLTVLGNLQILIPSKSIMMNWNNFIKPTYLKSKSNISKIRTLENLRDTLLPKLVSGEIRMKF